MNSLVLPVGSTDSAPSQIDRPFSPSDFDNADQPVSFAGSSEILRALKVGRKKLTVVAH